MPSKKKRRKGVGMGEALVKGTAGSVAISAATAGSQKGLSKAMGVVEGGDTLSRRERVKLKRSMGARGIPVVKTQDAFLPASAFPSRSVPGVAPALGRRFDSPSQTAAAGRRRGAAVGSTTGEVAHELGHLTGRSLIKPKAGLKAYQLGRAVGPTIAGIASGYHSGKKAPKDETVGKAMGRAAGVGAAAGLVGGAPTLVEEARASVRGMRGLARAGVKGKRLLRSGAGLGAALGTYVAGAAGVGASNAAFAAPFGQHSADKARRKARREARKKTACAVGFVREATGA